MKKHAIQLGATAAALGALLVAAPAAAAPILIDFTDSGWAGAAGETSFSRTYGSLDVTLNATGGNLTVDSDAPASGGPLDLYSDGIGIGDDEIGNGGAEAISVSFTSAVTVLGYYVLDLFGNEGPGGEGEAVGVSFSGGESFVGVGSADDGIGFYGHEGLNGGLGVLDTLGMQFAATVPDGYQGESTWFSDFALGGILVEPGSTLLARVDPENSISVPEPATLGILGLSLLGFGLARRRSRG